MDTGAKTRSRAECAHVHIQYAFYALEVKRQKKLGVIVAMLYSHTSTNLANRKIHFSTRCKKLGSGSHARLCYMLHHEGGGGVQRCTTFAGVLLLRGVNCFRCDGFLYML